MRWIGSRRLILLTGEVKKPSGACGNLPGVPLCGTAGEDAGSQQKAYRGGAEGTGGSILSSEDKLLEAQRITERTNFDIEMMRETGFCSGIENYSRHLTGQIPGQPPYTLFDYFPDDFLIMIDESHMTVPQIRGMYAGDRSRKNNTGGLWIPASVSAG